MTLVRDCYERAIHDVMTDCEVKLSERDHNIPADATFEHVLQYTEWHIGYLNRKQRYPNNAVQHYRYNRYRSLLERLAICEGQQVHIDIGCGAGVFSWAFLDWLTGHFIPHSSVTLYGYDHSQEMIRLSYMLKGRISQIISGYPSFYYYGDVSKRLRID